MGKTQKENPFVQTSIVTNMELLETFNKSVDEGGE